MLTPWHLCVISVISALEFSVTWVCSCRYVQIFPYFSACLTVCVCVHTHECLSVFHTGVSAKKILMANTCSPGKEIFPFSLPPPQFNWKIHIHTGWNSEYVVLFYFALFTVSIWYPLALPNCMHWIFFSLLFITVDLLEGIQGLSLAN